MREERGMNAAEAMFFILCLLIIGFVLLAPRE